MSNRKRILRGVAANLVTLATRIAVQFATLPLFFANWSADRIGAWLVLFAVPAYLGLVGNGFAGAGGNAALAAVQDGDQPRARADFRAAWAISSLSTGILVACFAVGFFWLIPVMPALSAAQAGDLPATLGWLALYIFATSQMAVAEIPYRAAGRYPDHIALYNLAALIEIAVIAACVTQSESFAVLAMALGITRCISAALIFIQARRLAPQMFEAGRGSLRASLDGLWKPSIAFMLVPLIFGLNLQGYVLLLGATFGAALLASFAVTRTFTRLLDLFTNLTYTMQFYESGYIQGPKEAIQRRLLATMTVVSLFFAAAFSAFLLCFGPWLQDLYSLGQTRFDPLVAIVLLAAAWLRALSAAPIALLTASNAHTRVVLVYLTGSAAALLLAAVLAAWGGSLAVILIPLVAAEACQLVPAMRDSLRKLDLSFGAFVRMLISRERLEDIAGAARQLRRKR